MIREVMAEIYVAKVVAEAKPSTSRSEDPVELVGEASCSGADGSTSPGFVPPATAAESPSFLTWLWIQIVTACSGVWGARGDRMSEPKVLGLASGAQQTQEDEVLSRIAASKSTWSEVPGRGIHHSVSVPSPSELSVSVPSPGELAIWEELKASAPKFFQDYCEEDLEFGRLIGEGGQAQIFEAKLKGSDSDYVLKVFKLDAGFSLADLKRHWPRSMRTNPGFVFEDVFSNIDGYRCLIVGATLFKNGRFAFLMLRYWGDLRTLIDLKVEDNTRPWKFDLLSKPLFSFSESIRIMLDIAYGMERLHTEGVLHRDLKASNVLVQGRKDDSKDFYVADYECAMFVQGTGFWRAPEVLQELQKKEEDRNGEIWTEKVDVYSFGMTCYEILTGQIPFDGYDKKKWGDIIKGERLCLPDFVFPELQELVEACWHVQPSQRPSFHIIISELWSIKFKYSLDLF